MRTRGQTSIEVLLIFSFVIVVVLAVVTPYVESQNKTNAAYVAKLTILPYIEKNSFRVKINQIVPEVLSGGIIRLHIRTNGNWDGYVNEELNNGVNGHSPGCQLVCDAVAKLGGYSQVEIDWVHGGDPYCLDYAPIPPVNRTC